jgi:polar amino acid transport system substrate-binding protein
MRRYLLSLVMLLQPLYAASAATTLSLYTEHMPPYSYQQGDKVEGINAELMRQLCQRLQLDCQLILLPWRRAFENAQQQPMSGVFSTARSEQRETLFRWVGPIASDWGYVFRLKGRLEVNPVDLEQAKHFKLAVARGDVYESYFRQHGFEYGLNMVDFATKSEPLPLFMAKRVDLLVGSKRSLRSWLRDNSLPEDSAEPLFQLEDVGDNYLALNLNFPADLALKMQQELELMRLEGKLDALIHQYAGQ